MATNGFSISSKNSDIELENGAGDIYGFHSERPVITETRVSQLTQSTGESAPTFRSAEPFEMVQWTDWSYGYGQVNSDREEGGLTGQGGNPGQYFYGDCFSLRPSKLLPGMARDLVYPTVSAALRTPISDGIDPVAGDEQEVPRGVLPCTLYQAGLPYIITSFTTGASGFTLTNFRVLAQLKQISGGSFQIFAELRDVTGVTSHITFSASIAAPTFTNYTGWKWVTLSSTGFALSASTTYKWYFYSNSSTAAAIGCYIGAANQIRPYFQLLNVATPYKYWTAPLQKVEQVLDGTTYVNVAITSSTNFNTATTGTAEHAIGGQYLGSIVANNTLLISGTSANGTWAFTPAQCTANLNAGTFDTNVIMFSPFEHEGSLIFADATRVALQKWNGLFPATGGNAVSFIVAAGKIGQSASQINGVVNFQGSAYVLKPEGVFKIISAISDISTAKVPDIIPVWTPPGKVALTNTGRWFVEHNGKLYFNWKNLIVEMVMQEDKPTITYYNPSPPWYSFSYYSYVNGLTSDGVNLFCSINNFGVVAFNSQGWHMITEFYEQVAVEGQASGLRWIPNPTGAPDYLFCGDGRTVLKIPIPNAYQPYTTQIFQNHQNKCGYWVSSEWTANLGDIEKNLRSAILRAVPNGWSYKLVAVVRQSGTSSSFNTLLGYTFWDGLLRDSWTNPTSILSANPLSVSTTLVNGAGVAQPNTLAPACWVSSDFNNSSYQSKKFTVRTTDTTATPPTTEDISSPVKVVKTQFILYFWNPNPGQAATVGTEVMSLDTIVMKHLPKLKYVARYQVSLNLNKLTKIGTVAKDTAGAHASTAWLRNLAVNGDPIYFRFINMAGVTKQVRGVLQGFNADTFVINKGDTTVFPLRADFNVLSIDEEEAT